MHPQVPLTGRRLPRPVVSAFAALFLAACGGGGGGDAVATAPTPAPAGGTTTTTAASPAAALGTTPTATPTPDPVSGTEAAVASPTSVGAVAPPVPVEPLPDTEPPAPAPSTAPAPVAAVQVTASLATVTPNTRYEVSAPPGAPVDLRLLPPYNWMAPVAFAAGDFVSVRGTTGTWRLVPGYSHTYTARGRTVPNFISTVGLPGNAAPGERWTPRLAPATWRAVASEPEGSVLVAADAGGPLRVSQDAGNSWSAAGSPAGDWVDVDATRMPWTNPSGAAGAVYMAAVARGGPMVRYTGSGWAAVVGPAGLDFSRQAWEAVAITLGNTAIGAVLNGPILSETAGALAAEGSTTPLVRAWRGLATGAAGLVAVNEEGEVWIGSVAGGLRQVAVSVGGTAVVQPWSRVAANGNAIAIAGRTDGLIYVSRDAGLNWTRAAAPAAAYTALSVAAGGEVVAGTSAAGIQLSRDGGASFAALPAPTAGGAWQAVALSDDGNQIAAANSQLYTSLGNRTAYTSGGGAIVGGAGDFVEVESLGGDRFRVRTASGGPFTIR